VDTDRGARTDTDTVVVDGADVDDTADQTQGRRRPGCGCWIAALVVLLLLGGAGAFLGGTIVFRQETAAPGEEFITDLGLRMVAVPSEYQDRRVPSTANVDRGRELFTTQCAFCHGQGGDGSSQLGATMYPRAAILPGDRTQSKTDGQLFWLIAHGINLTGMPGFGQDFGTAEVKGPNSEAEIWDMVAYIRTLNK
jgi:mono/diheme cytochrome c family protein